MDDFETRARRAGAAVRDEAHQRACDLRAPTASGTRHPRTGGMMAIGAVAAASLAIVLAIMFTGDDVVGPVIDPVAPDVVDDQPVAEAGVLPVPAVGEALPAYLENGRPVFVSHPEDGDVVVLDAIDPHVPWAWEKLVAYCPSSGWFEEPRHGSRFNGWGEWTGGPAPAGLAAYPSELTDDAQTVRITGPAQPRPDRESRREQPPQGPPCSTGEDSEGPPSIHHRPPADPPDLDASALSEDGWMWATLVLGGTMAEPLVCDADGTCPDDAPPADVATVRGGDPGIMVDRDPRVFLATKTDHATVRLLLPVSDALHPSARTTDGQPLLRLPEPGRTLATHLDDRAPVFVSHTIDGEVSVLDATSQANQTSLVAWCETDAAFVDGEGVLYGPHGRTAGEGVREGLRRYPFELIDVGETQAIRITGEATAGHADPADAAATGCVGEEQMMHLPAENDHVFDKGVHLSGEFWTWVRMNSRVVDGALYLCAGSAPCGEPSDDSSVRAVTLDAPNSLVEGGSSSNGNAF